jgi:hypothetical protein
MASHSTSVKAKIVSLSRRLGDALWTKIEREPSARTADSNNRRGAVGSLRSAAMKVAPNSRASAVPVSSAISLSASRAPSAAKAFATPRPIPEAAPVTSAVSPASNSIPPLPCCSRSLLDTHNVASTPADWLRRLQRKRRAWGPTQLIYVRKRSQAPLAMKTQPAIRETNLPNGNTFSNKTSPASAAIHSTFMTPPTNSSNIRAQQQPMQ